MSQKTRNAPPAAQLTLPGQSHTAEGPHDQTGMYVMHHGFRRDLAHFAAAVEHTPVSEAEVWAALHERWLKFAEVLHHHHAVEDENLWPVLTRYATGAGGWRTDWPTSWIWSSPRRCVASSPLVSHLRRCYAKPRCSGCTIGTLGVSA